MKEWFESLGSEDLAVVEAFVWYGGSVITFAECNESRRFAVAGIESLRSRELMHTGVTADGMMETFVLDTELFDHAKTAVPEVPF